MRFQVHVLKNGQAFQELTIDPTGKSVTMNELRTDLNGRVNWRFSGKNSELVIPESGTYAFEARLVAAPNPTLKRTKAELVLKK